MLKRKRDHGPKGPLELSRDALKEIWQECFRAGFVGRCWGMHRKDEKSDTPGSNIVLCDGQVTVTLFSESGERYAPIKMKVIGSPDSSDLPERIRQVLVSAGFL